MNERTWSVNLVIRLKSNVAVLDLSRPQIVTFILFSQKKIIFSRED